MTKEATAAFVPSPDTLVREVLVALESGPLSSDELRVEPRFLAGMAVKGLVEIDPDPWPDEFVPGNPYIARLPGDKSEWPGWKKYGWRR